MPTATFPASMMRFMVAPAFARADSIFFKV